MNLQNLILIVAMMAAFWFLLIRPQQQRQKKQAEMISALKPGARIVTIGGMFGTVVAAGERVLIEVADGTRIEFAPQAISQVLEPAADDEDPSADDEPTEQDEVAPATQDVLEAPTEVADDVASDAAAGAESSPDA
jgi:preprotein translocase subunit YajC